MICKMGETAGIRTAGNCNDSRRGEEGVIRRADIRPRRLDRVHFVVLGLMDVGQHMGILLLVQASVGNEANEA